jgi:hypothetical protein
MGAKQNGIKVYLAFHSRKVFETTSKLDQVFTFRDDLAWQQDLSWQNEEFELSNFPQPRVALVKPSSGPSSNVDLLAKSSVMDSNQCILVHLLFPPEPFDLDVLPLTQNSGCLRKELHRC